MPTHFWIVFVAALVPLIVGFIWYNPKVLGRKWMAAADINEEKMRSGNMGLVFGLTYLFSVFIASGMTSMVIHQFGAMSVLSAEPDFKDPNSEAAMMLKKFLELFGNSHRTFGHGAFHGLLGGIMLALPVIGINALFERKGFKYIAINAGFWILCFALMGGIICQWL